MVNPGFVNEMQPPQQRGNGMAVAGMVLGIIALVLCWVPFLNWVLALLGIVFGALGIARSNKVGRGKGMAISGLVCGLIGAILGTIMWIMLVRGVKQFVKEVKAIDGKVELDSIGRQADAYYAEHGSFPVGKADLTPAQDCCSQPGAQCTVNDADFSQGVWKDLDFQLFETKTRFRYSYESTDGKTFVAKAVSDADCDGEPATWEMHGSVDASGTPHHDLVNPPSGSY